MSLYFLCEPLLDFRYILQLRSRFLLRVRPIRIDIIECMRSLLHVLEHEILLLVEDEIILECLDAPLLGVLLLRSDLLMPYAMELGDVVLLDVL